MRKTKLRINIYDSYITSRVIQIHIAIIVLIYTGFWINSSQIIEETLMLYGLMLISTISNQMIFPLTMNTLER